MLIRARLIYRIRYLLWDVCNAYECYVYSSVRRYYQIQCDATQDVTFK